MAEEMGEGMKAARDQLDRLVSQAQERGLYVPEMALVGDGYRFILVAIDEEREEVEVVVPECSAWEMARHVWDAWANVRGLREAASMN